MFDVSFKLTAAQLYDAYLTSNTTGLVWRHVAVAGMVGDSDAAATIPQQAVPLTESVTRAGKFTLTVPSGLPADTYTLSVRHRAGGSPSISDTEVFADIKFVWDGTNVTSSPVVLNYEIAQG